MGRDVSDILELCICFDEEAKLFFFNYDLLNLRNFSGFEYKLTIDLKLCIALQKYLRCAPAILNAKWGIGEEGKMGDGQAQHGGIICVLQTEKISSE